MTPQRLPKIADTTPTPGAVSATLAPRLEKLARKLSCPPNTLPRELLSVQSRYVPAGQLPTRPIAETATACV